MAKNQALAKKVHVTLDRLCRSVPNGPDAESREWSSWTIPQLYVDELERRLRQCLEADWAELIEDLAVTTSGPHALVSVRWSGESGLCPLFRLGFIGVMDLWEYALYVPELDKYWTRWWSSQRPFASPESWFEEGVSDHWERQEGVIRGRRHRKWPTGLARQPRRKAS